MKIYNNTFVSYSRPTNQKKNLMVMKEEKVLQTPCLTFQANMTNPVLSGLRRVVIKSEETKAISNNFLSILKKLPQGSAMHEPRFYQVGEKSYAYLVDKKTDPTKVKLFLKSNVKNIEDWDNKDNLGTVLDCIFNTKGIMQVAKLEQKLSDKVTKISYHHLGNDGRRVNINDKLYRPIIGDNYFWTLMPNPNANYSVGKYDLFEEIKDVEFADLFLEFAKKKTSVLLK